jgi:hypothetical protein
MHPLVPIHIVLIGPVTFVIIIELINWSRVNTAGKLSISVLVYVLSVFIGALLGANPGVSNVGSAYVSGLIAPILIGTTLPLILWIGPNKTLHFFREKRNDRIDNEDDFLDLLDED